MADRDEVWCTRRDDASTFRLVRSLRVVFGGVSTLQSCITLSYSLFTGVILLFLGVW